MVPDSHVKLPSDWKIGEGILRHWIDFSRRLPLSFTASSHLSPYTSLQLQHVVRLEPLRPTRNLGSRFSVPAHNTMVVDQLGPDVFSKLNLSLALS